MVSERAQAFTVEGFVAAFLLLAAVAFALQATAVTPQSASTSSAHVEGQTDAMAGGLLDAARANDSLVPALLTWDPVAARFKGTAGDRPYHTACATPTAFGASLERTFQAQGFTCNVHLSYVDGSDTVVRQRFVYTGIPSDGAVRATTLVTLYDDDTLNWANTTATLAAIENDGDANTTFYVPADTVESSPVYAVVRVEVVVWRT